MEKNFYKYSDHIFSSVAFIIILETSLIAIQIYTISMGIVILWFILGFALIFLLVLFFFRSLIFRKIRISAEGITELYGQKEYAKLLWSDIATIDKKYMYKSQSLMFTSNSSKEIYLNILKWKLRAIIAICPLESLKDQLLAIKLFI